VLLAACTEQPEVSFGVVSAGRPEHLTRMAEMVGPLNNMLPVVVDVPDDANALAWLHRLQSDQSEMRQHQYASLAQIRDWGGRPWREPLYDSYLVYENFPMDARTGERTEEWDPQNGVTQTEHPLRLLIWPVGGLFFELSYYLHQFEAPTISRLLKTYTSVVGALAAQPGAPLGDLKRLAVDVFANKEMP
jgi:non-ribosomal peptide synthetase component F